MSTLFSLSDEQWAASEPRIPMNRPGLKPKRNREVISGIIHVLPIRQTCQELHRYRYPSHNRQMVDLNESGA